MLLNKQKSFEVISISSTIKNKNNETNELCNLFLVFLKMYFLFVLNEKIPIKYFFFLLKRSEE